MMMTTMIDFPMLSIIPCLRKGTGEIELLVDSAVFCLFHPHYV